MSTCACFIVLMSLAAHSTCIEASPCVGKNDASTGLCDAAQHRPRSGGAMIQTSTVSSIRGADDPVSKSLPLSSRLDSLAARITTLNERSGEGRTTLRTGLDKLKEATTATSGELENGRARVSAAEGAIGALQDVVTKQGTDLRAALDKARTDYENLKKSVGGQTMLLSAAEDSEDPHFARVAKMEAEVKTLEEESGNGRNELKTELDTLAEQLNQLQKGGADSLDHSISRVSSAEQQVADLAASVDEQDADLKTTMDALNQKLQTLANHVGENVAAKGGGGGAQASALEKKDEHSARHHGGHKHHAVSSGDPAAPAAAKGNGKLPLTSRIDSLEKRTEMLEGKSDEGRGDLQIQLDELTTQLETIKDGGARSLAYTVIRVGTLESEISALKASVAKQKEDVTKETTDISSNLAGLSGKVGKQ